MIFVVGTAIATLLFILTVFRVGEDKDDVE